MSRRFICVAATAIACLTIAVAAFFLNMEGHLTIRDGDTGQEYARYPMEPGGEFSITFIHSVNQTAITDCYCVGADGEIVLEKTIYYSFGAGVPFDLNPGETLSYGEDGAMIISGIDRTISDFYLFVGTVSDHTLSLGGEDVSLRELCGRNTKVRIAYEFPQFHL